MDLEKCSEDGYMDAKTEGRLLGLSECSADGTADGNIEGFLLGALLGSIYELKLGANE